MAKTRSMTRNHNHDDDDASIIKRIDTSVATCGVCKSWRSLALPHKIRFMASKPPMKLWISQGSNNVDKCCLVDFGGRSIIILPESGGRTCVALTCGYLVFLGTKTRDFMLLNPITRHGICFPKVPNNYYYMLYPALGFRVILVFSASIFTWVLVVLCRCNTSIWFSIAGKGEWGFVSSNSRIIDLHEFKGKIYAIDTEFRLYEVGIDFEPKLTLLKTKNTLGRNLTSLEFVSSGESLYAMEPIDWDDYKVHKLDFGEMKWMSQEKNTTKDHVFFVSQLTYSAAIRRGLWCESDSWLHHKYWRSTGNITFLNSEIWYFPHDCLKVNF
ncbi:hypothetical protein LXL04_010475 [Taraxacum kok-saghyz]